jgi:multiple sugar transport system substrate-binding protein
MKPTGFRINGGYIMKRGIFFIAAFLFMLGTILTACSSEILTGPKNQVVLTLWHNYGGQLKDTMDEMIDKFNETVGAKEGIIISVTSISGSDTLHDKLIMAANGEPGAPPLPDITTAYPKTALTLAQKGLLCDLNEQFTQEELSAYVPGFLEEGKILGDGLYVFPIAKSTEALFVNTTIFDRFAGETGVSIDDLKTFEGIFSTAALYYDWTDRQTPDIPNDGKMFFMADSLYNFSLIGCKQLGTEFTEDGTVDLTTPQARRVWESYYKSSVSGHAAIFDGYATDLAKTGDIVCSIGSTAGISFFSPTVTYADNTSEPVELAVLPYPTFEGGKRIALQRGGGMCVIRSTQEKERSAGTFLKWFTSPENNLHFVSSTGYLPVTAEAFGEIMTREMDSIKDQNIKKMLAASRTMQRDYEFCVAPLFEEVDKIQDLYENRFKETAARSRQAYLNLLKSQKQEDAYNRVSAGVFEEFKNAF